MSGGSDKGKGEGTKVEATEADVVAVAAEGEPAVEVARADEASRSRKGVKTLKPSATLRTTGVRSKVVAMATKNKSK